MEVEDWLRRLGLEQYAPAFRDNAIDAEVLPRLTVDDLKDIGVAAVGHRRRLLDAIAALSGLSATAEVHAAPAAPRAGMKDEAERRPITVMFCDLAGSTSMAADMDAEDWREFVGVYLDEAAKAVTLYGGHVLKMLGEGLMALFGYPSAQENDAERAARAGLAILRALEDLNANNAARGLPALAARIGLQSGPVVIDSSGEVFGEAPNVAARVQSAAEPGTLFVTAFVQRQLAGLFVVEDKGPHELKGVPGSPVLFRLVRASGGGRRRGARALTPLVGRREELATLARRWERAKSGEGQFVQIVGEPGLGKSRLVDEFHNHLVETPHTWVEWSSSQLLQNTPLHPLTEWGRQRFAGEAKFADLEAALAQVKLDPAEHAPLLAPLLDIAAPDERAPQLATGELQRRQLAAAVAWLLAGARAQPLVLAFEDLHWADPTTLDLMKTLAERGGEAPLLIVATARPEFRSPWTTRSHHGVISLSPLDRAQIGQMVGAIAAHHALSQDLVEGLSDRTAGVPLFIEELTRLVLEGGAQTVPPSLQQSLAARLDRLGEAREVAQVGAVLGRTFSHALLASVADIPASALETAVEKLAATGLLFVDGVAPTAAYRFKHALIQDAAYDSLLKSRRQVLHCRAAETLAAAPNPPPELVAHHFTQGGQGEQAVKWWGKAGDAALRRSSLREAIAHLGKAIEMGKAAPAPDMAKILSDYRRAVTWGDGQWTDRAAIAFEFAEQHASPSGEDEATRLSDFIILINRQWVVGNLQAAVALGQKASEQIRQLTDRGKLRWAHSLGRVLGVNHMFLGEWQAAYATLIEVANYFDAHPNDDGVQLGIADDQANASSYLMLAAWHVGQVREAFARGQAALARASAIGHLGTTVNYYAIRLLLGGGQLDRENLAPEAERFLELAEQLASPIFLYPARMFRSYAAGLAHQPSSAAADLRAQLAKYMDTGARLYAPSMMGRIAELEMRSPEWRSAGTTIEEGLKLIERGCDSFSAPYLFRLLGAFYARFEPPNLTEADRALRMSIEVASKQGARSERLISALALARLLNRSRRDLPEARRILLSAFDGFASESEFPAAAEARALLAEFEAAALKGAT